MSRIYQRVAYKVLYTTVPNFNSLMLSTYFDKMISINLFCEERFGKLLHVVTRNNIQNQL